MSDFSVFVFFRQFPKFSPQQSGLVRKSLTKCQTDRLDEYNYTPGTARQVFAIEE